MNLKVHFFVLLPSSAEDDPADHPDLPPAPHHREVQAGQAGRGQQERGRGRGDQAEGRRQPHLLVAGAGGQLYTMMMNWIFVYSSLLGDFEGKYVKQNVH